MRRPRFVFALLLACTLALSSPPIPAEQGADQGAGSEASTEKRGGWRLASAKSVYLREHAENPVEWYPWGEEAFRKAETEDLPIFLSIGYSSCHWCHVMRRLSFEENDVAEALARSFVAIKVDREELPHVDDFYMEAVQLITRRGGGWPLSVFLTPERKPFWGGTYFPKDTFLEILAAVEKDWNDPQRRKQIKEYGGTVLEDLDLHHRIEGEGLAAMKFVEKGVANALTRYDEVEGGFARPPAYSPKFPSPRLLVLYTVLDRLTGRADLRDAVSHTLREMTRGGIFDQVGGGFHRYTVDRGWAIPHFEKMLYTQGLLAETYLEVARMTGEREFLATARRTLDALLADFAVKGGGFASAWDADSGGVEGSYYVWNPESLEAAVGPQLLPLMREHLGIDFEGNFEHGPNTVPYINVPIPELAKQVGLSPDETRELVEHGLQKMLAARAQRVAPKRDDKVILGWNALAVSALARGATMLQDPKYIRAAEATHALAAKHLVRPDGLFRVWSNGEADYPATLNDVAYHLRATLDLYHATLEPEHITHALRVADQIVARFGPGESGGGFYKAAAGDEILEARRKVYWDTALPSGNGILAGCFVRLWGLTGDDRFRKLCDAIIAEGTAALGDRPDGSPELMLAVLMRNAPLPEVAIAGDPKLPATRHMIDAVRRGPQPFAVLAHRPPGEAGVRAASTIPLVDQRPAVEGRPTAYLCIRQTCQAPETDLEKFQQALAASWPLPPRTDEAKEKDSAPATDSRPSSRPTAE